MAHGSEHTTLRIDGRCRSVAPGLTLAQALASVGAAVDSPCGGRGVCGRCAVRIDSHCPPPTSTDMDHLDSAALARGVRLACRHIPVENMHVSRITEDVGIWEITHQEIEPDPLLGEYVPDGWLSPTAPGAFGIVLDVGTTTITASVVHLQTGAELKTAAMTNPQVSFGADVVSRLEAASRGQARLLRRVLIEGAADLLDSLMSDLGLAGDQVAALTMVGNTAMHHMFLGMPVDSLGTAPYRPHDVCSHLVPAAQAGLQGVPDAVLFCPGLVWGFVGSDVTAGMLATSIDRRDGITLFVDMGTNTEIVAHHRGKLVACAAAAGPAFEGAHTSCGMRASPGAITRVQLTPEPRIDCIGDIEPVGLTGSGALDLLAEGLRWGLIDPSGRITGDPPQQVSSLLREDAEGELSVQVAPGIGLTQRDVRQLQMAKGAIAAGVRTVVAHLGAASREVDHVYLAGAFGSSMDPGNAARIGLFGDMAQASVVSVGNSAVRGGGLALLSSSAGDRLEEYRRRTQYLELAVLPGFQSAYIDALRFPESTLLSVRARVPQAKAHPPS